MLTLKIQSDFKCLNTDSFCGNQRYKCDLTSYICSETNESILNNGVYGSLCECQKNCGCFPCETEGCNFEVQFYYLNGWGHSCDYAKYNAYCGSRILGSVNFDNALDGGSRYSSWFNIGVSDFNAITCSYSFRLNCVQVCPPFWDGSQCCHQGISGLKFRIGGIVVLDLQRNSGDSFGVCGGDICNLAP